MKPSSTKSPGAKVLPGIYFWLFLVVDVSIPLNRVFAQQISNQLPSHSTLSHQAC